MINPFVKMKNKCHKEIPATVLVSRDRVRRQALRARLGQSPHIWVVAAAIDGPSALTLVQRHQPALLIIDDSLLPVEIEWLLGAVRLEAPQTRCLLCGRPDPLDPALPADRVDALLSCDAAEPQWQGTLTRLATP